MASSYRNGHFLFYLDLLTLAVVRDAGCDISLFPLVAGEDYGYYNRRIILGRNVCSRLAYLVPQHDAERLKLN